MINELHKIFNTFMWIIDGILFFNPIVPCFAIGVFVHLQNFGMAAFIFCIVFYASFQGIIRAIRGIK